MENIKVDKKSFYGMMEQLFNDVYGPFSFVTVERAHQEYRKIEDDFYKCRIEECYLVNNAGEKILVSSKPLSGDKKQGIYSIGATKYFDASVLTIEDIDELINNDVSEYPFLSKIPYVISYDVFDTKKNSDGVLVIDEDVSSALCQSFGKYINSLETAEYQLNEDISKIYKRGENK